MSDTKLTDEQWANVRKFVDALRSGKYQQTMDELRTDDAFCCLGVACDIIDPSCWVDHGYYVDSTGEYSCDLPPKVAEKFGFTGFRGPDVEIGGVLESLAGHNDAGRTFAEIADAIESQILNA